MIFGLILAAGLSWIVRAGEIRGRWRELPEMPTARQEVAFDLLGGQLVVIGGLGGARKVEAFDPETQTWSGLPDLPVAVHHGSAATVEGKIYSIGGFSNDGGPLFGTPLSAVFEFDPDRGTWEARQELPSPRGGLVSRALEGRIYSVGGRNVQNSLPSLLIYDPQTDSWSQGADLPVALDHLAAAVLDGLIYVAGGRVTAGGAFVRNDPTLAVYDPAAGNWSVKEALPTARSGQVAVPVAGFLLVMGGEIPGVFATNEAYDPQNDRWFSLPGLPTARHGLAAAAIGERIITAGGGLVAGVAPSGVSEEFTVFPQVYSLGQFASGPEIRSTLLVSNPGPETVQARFEFHSGEEGAATPVSVNGVRDSSFDMTLPPGGLRFFHTDGENMNLSGAVTLFCQAPVLSNVLFSSSYGLAGVPGLVPGRHFFVSVLRDGAEGSDSGLAVADVSGVANRVSLQLLNEDGEIQADAQRLLQPFGQFADLFDEIWTTAVSDGGVFRGSIRVQSEHEVGVLAILLTNSQFATLPVRAVEE